MIETATERAEQNAVCRQMVHNISEFGITDRQRKLLIYLLALELENVQLLQDIIDSIKTIGGDDLFIADQETRGD